jgi:hypothetical protein
LSTSRNKSICSSREVTERGCAPGETSTWEYNGGVEWRGLGMNWQSLWNFFSERATDYCA